MVGAREDPDEVGSVGRDPDGWEVTREGDDDPVRVVDDGGERVATATHSFRALPFFSLLLSPHSHPTPHTKHDFHPPHTCI